MASGSRPLSSGNISSIRARSIGPPGGCFAIANQPGVGLDLEQAGTALAQVHRADVGDLHLAALGGGERLKVGEEGRCRQGRGKAEQFSAGHGGSIHDGRRLAKAGSRAGAVRYGNSFTRRLRNSTWL